MPSVGLGTAHRLSHKRTGETLYFRAFTEEAGLELYRITPGSNTPSLVDINLGPESSHILEIAEFKGAVYFNAFTEEAGNELYRIAPRGVFQP